MKNNVSEKFMKTFSDGTGSVCLTCACGRTHFDTYNTSDYDSEEEYRRLCQKSAKNPDEYIGHDGSISTYSVNGLTIVYGCPCNKVEKYEKFIRDHSHQIAKFLNLLSEELVEESKRIRIINEKTH